VQAIMRLDTSFTNGKVAAKLNGQPLVNRTANGKERLTQQSQRVAQEELPELDELYSTVLSPLVFDRQGEEQ